MIDILYKEFDVDRRPLKIGKQGEKNARPVTFNFADWARFGEGSLSLIVTRSDGLVYPVELEIEGTTATWLVSLTDTEKAGSGSIELKYTVGDTVIKSKTISTVVYMSNSQNPGPAPDPYETWLATLVDLGDTVHIYAINAAASATAAGQSKTAAETAKTEAVSAAAAASESAEAASASATEAEESAESAEESASRAEAAVVHAPMIGEEDKHWYVWDTDDGEYVDTGVVAEGQGGGGGDVDITAEAHGLSAGSTPTVTKTGGGDDPIHFDFGIPAGANGQPGTPGQNGQPGADGYSPTVEITTITGGHRITITDKNGTHTADILDGEDGDPGQPGAAGVSPTVSITTITGGHRIAITDASGTHTADVLNGTNGQPGADGDDGFSPTVSITEITGGHRVTITDASGAHQFDVMDGQGGGDIETEEADELDIDTAVTEDSAHLITSGAVYDAIAAAIGGIDALIGEVS